MVLDHLPVCAAGLAENAIGALCREEGFSHGTSSPGPVVGTCRMLTCTTSNLLNCEMSFGVNQEAANIECDQEVGVQLLGGMQADRGHVTYLGGLLCDDDWNSAAADVVCRELGFSGAANLTTHSYFGPVETPLMVGQGVLVPYSIKSVACNGTEEKLSECNITTASESDCQFGEAAGVICITDQTDRRRKRRKREAKKTRISPAAVLLALNQGAQGANSIAQGANSVAETAASLNAAKESLTQLFDRGPAASSGGDQMLASALSYFEKKQQEREQQLKEMMNGNNNPLNLGPVGVEVKLQHSKGYMDLGGEFQDGGSDIKIQEISGGGQQKQSGGDAYTYPSGIGPMLVNGCFGSNYKKGDPCYAAKKLTTKCKNMMEAANFIGAHWCTISHFLQ